MLSETCDDKPSLPEVQCLPFGTGLLSARSYPMGSLLRALLKPLLQRMEPLRSEKRCKPRAELPASSLLRGQSGAVCPQWGCWMFVGKVCALHCGSGRCWRGFSYQTNAIPLLTAQELRTPCSEPALPLVCP